MQEKVVLAFSGGLDTSFCALWLAKEKGLEVHTVTVDTGGFSEEDLAHIAQRAHALGVVSHKVLACTEVYYEKCLKYLLFGNVLRNGVYPLSVSSERMFQALAVAEYALEIGAKHIAHGSTGAGNDQVRFDLAFKVLAPSINIITPIRDLKLSREAEIAFLQENGVAGDWAKAMYSINKGLWGTSIGGKETLTSHLPLPEDAFPSPCLRTDTERVCIAFEKGEPVAFQGRQDAPTRIIQALNELGAGFAIGRDMHIGDTIIGIKGRVAFEAPAALMLIKAHQTLEKHTLTKWQQYWKEQLANWYGMFLHEAQLLDPVMRNIESFLMATQANVTGEVFLRLSPYRFEVEGIQSPFDLMNSHFGSYGEMNNAWTGEDVKGFINILANPLTIYHQTHPNETL